MYLRHVSQLLLQVVTLMRDQHSLLSLKELDLCHEICLYLLHKLLRVQLSQPASLASTPSSTPATPSSLIGRSLASAFPTHGSDHLESNIILSLAIQIYDEFLLFFSNFLKDRFIPDISGLKDSMKDLCVSLSSSCQSLILVSRLICRSEFVSSCSEGTEKEGALVIQQVV